MPSYPETLRLYANALEQNTLISQQLDIAVKTKAEIGSRREATAMATASAKARENEKLKEQIGDSKMWKCAKAIPWVLDIFAPSRGMWIVLGKKLKSVSDEIGCEVRKIEHEKFGTVNAYHRRAIEKTLHRIKADSGFMGKYRIEA